MTVKPTLLEIAIGLAGSQAKLGEGAGVSQAAINKAKKVVERGGKVSADLAVGIERATDGAVPRWRLRPDLWEQPQEAAE